MSHFAKVENGVVTDVTVAEQDFINSGALGNPSLWVQTSYNTKGGIHYAPNSNNPDGGIALRKNYAVIGGIYDVIRDAFYKQSPYPSWVLNEESCLWEAPTPKPNDGKKYNWDENTLNWVAVNTTQIDALKA